MLLNPLPHYKAKQVRVDGRRLYQIEGHHYPGVTTILSATKPPEAKQALYQWRQRVGAAEANRITAKATSSGTKIHKHIEAFLNGDSVPDELADNGFWQSIKPVLAKVEESLLVEGAVWHDRGFAGFPDALVQYEGNLCLCDWKTARKPKRPEWITDYYLQVAAYCQAVNHVYRDYGIEVKRALVAIALEDAPAQLFPLDLDELDHHWLGFQARLRAYGW